MLHDNDLLTAIALHCNKFQPIHYIFEGLYNLGRSATISPSAHPHTHSQSSTLPPSKHHTRPPQPPCLQPSPSSAVRPCELHSAAQSRPSAHSRARSAWPRAKTLKAKTTSSPSQTSTARAAATTKPPESKRRHLTPTRHLQRRNMITPRASLARCVVAYYTILYHIPTHPILSCCCDPLPSVGDPFPFLQISGRAFVPTANREDRARTR